METRELGRTGLQVSVICLGTMTWGEQNSEGEGHAQMDMALEHGVNFFDTAEIYAIPPRRETAGRTEEIIGAWFEQRKSRDKVILATKVAGRSSMDWLRADSDSWCCWCFRKCCCAAMRSCSHVRSCTGDIRN